MSRQNCANPSPTHVNLAARTNGRENNNNSPIRYRVNLWADIVSEDGTSEIMNVFGMMLSMVGILLKYKTCAWLGILVAAVSYANVRSNHDGKQIMSTFMLSISSVVMCYLTNPQPISVYLGQQQSLSPAATSGALDLDASSGGQ